MITIRDRKIAFHRIISLAGIFILLLSLAYTKIFSLFFNIPTIGLLLIFVFLMLWCTFGNDFLKFFPDSIFTLFTEPQEPILRYAEIAKFGGRYSISGAVIITLISFINIFSGMEDPFAIGPAAALSLLPIFYALILSEIFFAFLYKVYSDSDKAEIKETLSFKYLVLPVLVIFLILAVFVISFLGITSF